MIKNVDETIEKLRNGYSIARYGDGEFYLMAGEDIYFQPVYPELQKRLREIIRCSDEGILVGIPSTINTTKSLNDEPKVYWKNYYLENRSNIYKFLQFNKQYYDSLVTRLYIDHSNKELSRKRFRKLKEVWKDRDVIIIEGEKSRLGIGNDFFCEAKSVKRIIGPAKDAYCKQKEIFTVVEKNVDTSHLLLLALGPAATVFAFDFFKKGYQAIDLGHADIEYEWMLMNAEKKIPVKDKNIWEVKNGEVTESIFLNLTYENSIIEKIL